MLALAVSGSDLEQGGAAHARLRRLVHEATGLDLEPYKERFIERRVAIRMRATGHQRLEDYLPHLAGSREEMERLLRCLTIHVSSFFRNPSTFEAIRGEVLPVLFAKGASRRPRIWSVGCSRGEEPYSLAILIHDHLGAGARGWDVQIDAIDVDDRVLEAAKGAEYGWQQVADVEPRLRERYFVRGERWQLAPEIRRMVRFHRRDILMEPAGAAYDLVLCRNLLIYIDRAGQEAVLERFARCLRPGGFLVLGRTEVFVGPARDQFAVVDPRERIYRRLGAAEPAAAEPAAASTDSHGGW